MKKTYTILLLFLACYGSLFSQKKDRLIQFSGYALTADSLMGVPFAHITILNRGRVATAGPDGFFSFAAHEGDTLYFTCIGFSPVRYIIPEKLESEKFSVIQMMTKSDIYLPNTIIYPWGGREQFPQAFKDLRLPDDDLQRAKRNMDRERLAELGEKLEMDGGEATNIALRNSSAKTYYYRQNPPQNIFNPLAWAEFIRAWKRGDFKKQ
ncbi:MAG: carboxypeptidase-like regulatory domain-containing protein [Bacteroidota bacterium]